MVVIQYADGTFTTREPHEVDPHAASHPDRAVDHGPVITAGIPAGHPTEPLGIEDLPIREIVPVTYDTDAVRQTVEPGTMQTDQERAAAVSGGPEASRRTPEEVGLETDDKPHLASEVDASGSVPQGRLTIEEEDDESGRHARRPHRRTRHDND